MADSSVSSGSSKNSNADLLKDADLERCERQARSRPLQGAVLLRWKPLWAANWRRDLVRATLCLIALICVAQATYIIRLRAGLARIPNASFDNLFHNQRWDSPSIWNVDRQSFVNNVSPIRIHSHNDYLRSIPLFEALGSGCISIEADVHLRGSELLIGHTSRHLDADATLRTMYLDPLQRILEAQNKGLSATSRRGIWNQFPDRTLVLLIDLKTDGPKTLEILHAQLQSLRDLDYLTHWNGTARIMRPLTIVATGNAALPPILALNDTNRDIFLDAPLDRLSSVNDDFTTTPYTYTYNQSNSYLASTRFANGVFHPRFSMPVDARDSPEARDIIASQAEQAKARGLITRYWDTPSGPQNHREVAWRFLTNNDVGLLNMDDLGIVRDRADGWGEL